jgi:hypothetical protein
MQELMMTTYTIALPVVLGYIVWLLQEQKKEKRTEKIKKNAERVGLMLMTRYMLRRYHVEYMWQGYITEEQYIDFEELHNAYHELGGNSIEEKWFEEIKLLPLKEGREELSPYAKAYFESLNKGECR